MTILYNLQINDFHNVKLELIVEKDSPIHQQLTDYVARTRGESTPIVAGSSYRFPLSLKLLFTDCTVVATTGSAKAELFTIICDRMMVTGVAANASEPVLA